MLRSSYSIPLAFLAVAASLVAAPPDASLARAKAAFTQLPLRFESNRGQFDPSVRFAARGGGYDLLFTPDGATLRYGSTKSLNISLTGSNRSAAIQGIDPLRARTNYLVGPRSAWHTDVANFGRLQYSQVYPGIDLLYYGSNNRLEYDFVLAPGADPATIRMRFEGAGKLRVTPEGDLAYEGPDGVMLQHRPVIYQEDAAGRHEIAGRYALVSRDTVAVRVNGYDRRRKLVIDPVISYSTYLGGSQTDQINGVQLSSKGLLYMCGSTQTQDIPAINGAYNNITAGLTDIFLAILDPSAQGNDQLVYFSYLGGSNIDAALAIAVDPNGVAYMTGTTNSTDFPIVGNSVQTLGPAVVTEAFVAVIDPSQYGQVSLIYSTFLGGQTGNNSGNAITLDSAGNMYIAGTTASSDFPASPDSAYGIKACSTGPPTPSSPNSASIRRRSSIRPTSAARTMTMDAASPSRPMARSTSPSQPTATPSRSPASPTIRAIRADTMLPSRCSTSRRAGSSRWFIRLISAAPRMTWFAA